MKLHKSIFLLLFLFISRFCFAQKAIEIDENKTTTPLYEVSFNKSSFDFYNQSNYGFILFYKLENDDDFLDCLRLSVENLEKYKTMDLMYYASLVEYVIREDFKIIESRKVENQGKTSYFLLVYEKPLGKKNLKIHHRIYFNNGFGFNFSLRTVTNKFDKLYSDSEEILNSFQLR
ncbi:hypothetical protein GCM10022389_10860 [Flavobacterium cheonanense]|uniref:Uncharacterized protein n=1 Tax=Flavobacterium cheonanense TaxID=706183 RepID=A0ABP7VIH7_9FLAO|nr:hypothetical protein [Flavobacterium sp.]